MGVGPLTLTCSDSQAKYLLSIPMTLCSAGVKVLVPGEVMLPPRDLTVTPLTWKLRWPLSHFLMPLKQQAAEAVAAAGTNGPYYYGTPDCCSTREARKHAWGTGDALGCLLLSPRPVMVTWKQQLSVGRTANGPDSVGMRAGVTPQSEVPAEGKRNTKWVLEEGSYRYQLRPQVTQTLQTGDTDPVST